MNDGLRSGDSGAGIPEQPPAQPQAFTPAEEQELARRRAREQRAEVEAALAPKSGRLRLPDFLFQPVVVCLLVVAAGTLALFVTAQAASLFSDIAQLPVWAQWLVGGAAAVVVAAVAAAMLRLMLMYWRLERTRQVSLLGMEELADRQDLQQLVAKKRQQAVARLKRYVKKYGARPERTGQFLADMGLPQDALERLWGDRTHLLDAVGTSDDWVQEFQSDFLRLLDRAAEERVRSSAWRVGWQTAAAPLPLADTLVTLYHGHRMLADLCRIYNLRLGGACTAVVLARLYVQAYVAGQTDIHETVGEKAFTTLSRAFGVFAEGSVLEKIVGKTLAKAAAGSFNAFLLCRLGRAAMRMLRPLASE